MPAIQGTNHLVEERIIDVSDVINQFRVEAERVIIGLWKQIQLQLHGKRTSVTGKLFAFDSYNFTISTVRCVLLFTQNRGLFGHALLKYLDLICCDFEKRQKPLRENVHICSAFYKKKDIEIALFSERRMLEVYSNLFMTIIARFHKHFNGD